jgi:hypothetical protein
MFKITQNTLRGFTLAEVLLMAAMNQLEAKRKAFSNEESELNRKCQSKHTVDRLNPSQCDFAALTSEFSGGQSSFLCSGRFTAGWPVHQGHPRSSHWPTSAY